MSNHARRFVLNRRIDVTGVSGTGPVADGVEFPDGRVAMRWRPGAIGKTSTATYDDIDTVNAIHGHDGATQVVWLDDGPAVPTVLDEAEPLRVGVALHAGERRALVLPDGGVIVGDYAEVVAEPAHG